MSEDRKAKVKALRQRLANLTDAEQAALKARAVIVNVEGHALSLTNTMLLYLQGNGHAPSVVGGYQQWKAAGRQVRQGEHGMIIWFPVGKRDEDGKLEGEVDRFFTGTVFDISQTDPIAEPAQV